MDQLPNQPPPAPPVPWRARIFNGLSRRIHRIASPWNFSGAPSMTDVVEAVVQRLVSEVPGDRQPTLGPSGMALAEGVIATLRDYGELPAAARWAEWLASRQRGDEERDDGKRTASARTTAATSEELRSIGDDPQHRALTTAKCAGDWYRLGQRDRADRALSWLIGQWHRQGRFVADDARQPITAEAWTCKYFLDAVRWQVQSLFDSNLQQLPDEIETADRRWQVVRDWMNQLPPAGRVVDVGCGSGRFLKRTAEECRSLRLVGVDISPRALDGIPANIETHVGSLLRIPLAGGSCDGALAVESLEHALRPQRAVDELCRVVRPGGSVLVIDKHRDRQRQSVHQPWERWFMPDEVAGWLERHCDQVTVEPIADGRQDRPHGLFLAWSARRRDR